MSHVKKYRLATIEVILVITLIMMGGGFVVREAGAETKGLTIGYKDNILFSEATKLTASGDNVIFGLLSASSTAGSFLKFQHIKPNGAYEDIFVIDHAGNITTTGQVLGSNNYWKLNGSSTNLYASSTAWNVGIGTTNPGNKLEVAGGTIKLGSGAWPTATAGQTNQRVGVLSIVEDSYLIMANMDNGIAANRGSHIYLGARKTTGVDDLTYVRLTAARENATEGSSSAYFSITAGGSERLRMTSGGNVGIGTTSPATKLHIYDASSGPILTMSGLDTNYRGLTIKNTANAEQWFTGNNASNNFVIRRSGSTDYFTLTNNGNVGIGATNPTNKMLVAGTLVNTTSTQALKVIWSGGSMINDSSGIYPAILGEAIGGGWYSGNYMIGLKGVGGRNNRTGGTYSIGVQGQGIYIENHTYTGPSYEGTVYGGHFSTETSWIQGEKHLNNAFGVYIKPITINANSFANNVYGLYIDSVTNNGTLNGSKFGLYQSDASMLNYFAGNTGIGSTTPTAKLAVSGSSGNGIGVSGFSGDAINVGGGQVGGLASMPLRSDHAVPLGYLQAHYNPISTSFWTGTSTGNIYNTNAQNVGIGTAVPVGVLNIQASSTAGNVTALVLDNSATGVPGNRVSQYFRTKNSVALTNTAAITASTTAVAGGNVTADLDFSTVNIGTFSSKMIIKGDGNVGIGNQSPQYKLDVSGDFKSSGDNFVHSNEYKKLVAYRVGTSASSRGDIIIPWPSTTSGPIVLDVEVITDTGSVSSRHYVKKRFYLAAYSGYGAGDLYSQVSYVADSMDGNTTQYNYIGTFEEDTTNGRIVLPIYAGSSAGQPKTITLTARGTKEVAALIQSATFQANTQTGITPPARSYVEAPPFDSYVFNTNVGIGLTNPTAKLEVAESIVELSGTTGAAHGLLIDRGSAITTTNLQSSIFTEWNGLNSAESLTSRAFAYKWQKADGTNWMIINNSGSVGIGLTNPTSTLHISGGTGDVINISGGQMAGLNSTPTRTDHAVPLGYLQANYNPIPGGTSGQTLRHNGTSWIANSLLYNNGANIGIGLTNPSQALHIYNSSSSTAGVTVQTDSGDASNWSALNLVNPASSGWGGAGIHPININFKESLASTVAAIGAGYDQAGAVYIDFHSIYSGGYKTDNDVVMRIKGNGNVGIGSTNPSQKLSIYNASSAATMINIANQDETSGFSIGLDSSESGWFGTVGNRDMKINANNTEVMRIKAGGNVGIGASNPSSRLTLAGGDFELDHNKSIKVSSTTGNTTLLLGNYADESGFSYGTSSTLRSASLAVEGDVKADRLCFENDCKTGWSEVVSSGGGSQWATSSSDIYNANSGNVGIGKSNPVTSKLQILASGSGLTHEKTAGGYFYSSGFNSDNPYLTYYSSTGLTIGYGTNTGGAPTVNTMTLFNNGYVAIGTTATQTAKFYVSGGSISDGNGTGATLSANGLFMDNDELSTTAGTLFIGNSSNNFKHINLGASLYVKANGTIGIGTTTPIARLAITSSGTGTGRAFSVSDSNNIEKVTILDNGSVGIGITTSTSTLAVKGAGGLRITNGGYDANLIFGATDAWKSGIRVADNGDAEMRIWHANANGQIVLATGYNGDGSVVMPTDGLFIDQNKVGIGYVSPAASTGKLVVNGNVGIGTTNPASKLVVSGGGIYVSGVTSNSLDAGGGQVGGLANTPTEKTQAISWGFATSTFFMQGGNSFGATSVLGTNDNNHLNIKTNNSVRMTIANGGNIGIGTTNPVNQLSITKSGGLSIFDVTSYNSAANNRSILFFRTAQGTEASPTNVSASDMIGEFIGSGYAGGAFRNVAGMNFQIDPAAGSITSGNLPSLIYFETTSIGSTTRIERMRITSSGNVGIGTTNPGAKLQVAGDLLLSGTGKLTANTIDPPYFIDGRKYATYMAGMTGVKEETTGVVKLRLSSDKSYYYHVLDIGRAEEGSDLWLFGRTANLKQNGLNAVTVLLAPSFSGRVWYEKDSAKQLITIKASGLKGQNNLEVSYRLSAPRFDTEEYGNRRPDSDPYEGINLDKLLK